jgi:hypothetical protein
MCNNYEQYVAWEQYKKAMEAQELGIPAHQSADDLPQAPDIRIGDIGPVMRASGNVIELAPMTFGFPPPKPKASPVFNFRSEAAKALEPKARFAKVNVDDNPEAARQYGIQGIPALFAFRGGKVAARQAGLSDPNLFRTWVTGLSN